MVNIWDYTNAIKIKLTVQDGQEFIGDVVAIFDKEETYDDEDSIDLRINDRIVGFLQNEIKNIEVIE